MNAYQNEIVVAINAVIRHESENNNDVEITGVYEDNIVYAIYHGAGCYQYRRYCISEQRFYDLFSDRTAIE